MLNFLSLLLVAILTQSVTRADAAVEAPNSVKKCTNPSVRKEWRSFTTKQKENWISAVNCLAKLPSSGNLRPSVNPSDIPPVNISSSWYDDFVYVHMDLNQKIHQTGLFLPWHRYYVWSYEQSLKELCGYTGVSPYWDWSKDAPDFQHGTIFADPNPKSGLGGWGNAAVDQMVQDGGFKNLNLAYPIPHHLRRQYTPYPFLNLPPPLFTQPNKAAASTFTKQQVNYMVNSFEGDFKSFQAYFEDPEGAHTSVHLIMGGDLSGTCPAGSPADCTPGPKWSPNEPLFWMHHAMVDKVWYDWQHKHSDNFYAFEAGTVVSFGDWPKYPNGAPPAMHFNFSLPTDGILKGTYTVGDVFSTTDGPLCYIYQ